MIAAFRHSAAVSLRILALSGLLMVPVGALAYGTGSGLGIEKKGAGLVLFISLQRNAMQ